MALKVFDNVKIAGIACAVPNKVFYNSENKNFPENELKRFVKNIGVSERRSSIFEQTASDLCYEAARKIIEGKNVKKEDIDALIFITQNADYFNPSTAYVIANRLGLSNNCMAFDVNLGCSAFVYGTSMAASFITGGYSKMLVLIGDANKRGFSNLKDELLFGDCGSAVLFEQGHGVIKSELKSDGGRYTALITKGGGARHPNCNEVGAGMSGEDVMNFTINDVPDTINNFLIKTNQKIEDFDYILLHQANMMMLKTIIRKIGAKSENVPISMDRFGNVNGSSIPLTLVDLKERENIPNKITLLTSGFGVGLSWGVNSFDLDTSVILPLIETDNFYQEAF